MTPISTSPARREPLGLGRVQRRRKLALLVAALLIGGAIPFISSFGGTEGFWHESVEIVGMVLIAAAIVGRSWCALYIGGRKAHEIVATGPYSISRNPLYLFSLLAVLGIGFQTGSVAVGLVGAAIAFTIFLAVILKEEEALLQRFGDEFVGYRRRVPRFGPRVPAWRDTKTIVVHPKRLWRTFAEALLFLLAIPLCESIDKLQDAGYLAPLIRLF
jgi:protein-S-isoprenylcysteine O-methyltransferase Ste14